MCVDANAGARAQARQQAAAKDARYQSEGLKFFNRETTLERTQNQNVIGLSRDQSDAYAQAIATIGKGRKRTEDATRAYFATMSVDEGGRSRRFGKLKYQGLLAKNAEVESTIQNVLGRNMARTHNKVFHVYSNLNKPQHEKLSALDQSMVHPLCYLQQTDLVVRYRLLVQWLVLQVD